MPLFTFVNVADGPALDQAEAKRMRRHITRTNFASRRRRLVHEGRKVLTLAESEKAARSPRSGNIRLYDDDDDKEVPQTDAWRILRWSWLYQVPVPPSSSLPQLSIQYLLLEFRPVLFPAGNGGVSSSNERAWAELFLSEPALLEASMAIAVKYHPEESKRWRADRHDYNAVKLINERMSDPEKILEDGTLAAVFTLGFGERIRRNPVARLTHIKGLAQMLRLRRARGKPDIPAWFSDIIVYDAVSKSLETSCGLNDPVSYDLTGEHFAVTQNSAKISAAIWLLAEPINAYRRGTLTEAGPIKTIETLINQLHILNETLFAAGGPLIHALAHGLRIFLHLLWPSSEPVDMPGLVSSQRKALSQAIMRLCSTIELIMWQLFIGAVAAEKDSNDRAWFIGQLSYKVQRLGMKTWGDVEAMLDPTFPPDETLSKRIFCVWTEIRPRE